ncbi:MAG: iron ABC transporter permease [candidate division KSB1 bacterium]|nr:iron ABC transporter permease [candidate division KSB1 bacterium]MDZ7335772.1 iron ABC transporter permease [candidate division KSB1 bacterium]MDZ7358651.1 iron ABC transporter permease [candidate division KSB1 bacterium]MDZ7400759.1 iron ABC transporter permease [candidate division KSB1 bacterium]
MIYQKRGIALTIIISAAIAVLLITPFWGMESISIRSIFDNENQLVDRIFWMVRLPRVLAAFLAGAALAISGMVFQAMFRNPLATPFTLGVSSGAAFGAAVYIKIGVIFSAFGVPGQSLAAFIGASLSVILVYGFSRMRKIFTPATMLMAGVAINFFFSSLILFIQYLSDYANSFRIIRWLMGGFEIAGFRPVFSILPFVIIGALLIALVIHELNLLLLGEDIALSRGVAVNKIRAILFFATSLMIGAVVSVCGPIGFIGMMTPHICRLILGPDHRLLAPASFFFGGAFLVLCDTVARILIAPAEIPVGVITALLGGPFFLWLLLSGSSEHNPLG